MPQYMAYYIFTSSPGDPASRSSPRDRATRLLRVGMWGLGPDEPHCDALTPGDLVLIYIAAPEREFIGSAQLASPARDWTATEAQAYPGDSGSGVVLARVEEWNPPVPVDAVLARIDPAEKARADFEAGVVRITAGEYQAALAVSAGGPTNSS
jgi:hypothetical protein